MMDQTSDKFKQAVQDKTVPHLALLARSRNGTIPYEKYYGPISQSGADVCPKTIFTLASMTKLPTTVAALKLVEDGLLGLDDDISSILPVLGRQKVLLGFDLEGKPCLQDRQNPITLRQLLTHSAGLGYDFSDEELARFQSQRGRPIASGSTIEDRFDLPLLYEPGRSWDYGCSIDWAGSLVEKITNKSLEDYMNEKIWHPLGVDSFSFKPPRGREMASCFAMLTMRDGVTGSLKEMPGGLPLNIGVEGCFGGQGGYSTIAGFTELLHSILSDDERVLSKDMTEMMFQPQLTEESQAALQYKMRDPSWAIGDFDPTDTFNWGFGGLLVNKSSHGQRGCGTLIWSGAPNLFWFIDRQKGICGCFATQVLPPADPRIAPLMILFQKEVYTSMSS